MFQTEGDGWDQLRLPLSSLFLDAGLFKYLHTCVPFFSGGSQQQSAFLSHGASCACVMRPSVRGDSAVVSLWADLLPGRFPVASGFAFV